ncbi:X-box-binding protein 1 isoform X2 [Falco rusticolus]|uniref:X-box-binding protein 1 isoform X2 n=1 Tax=Falco rusticolus TaxID=120794 RepID=UPI0018868F7C|nr:X-box-binding protein 1 isoform X2 [Falco rusticolus]
MAALPGTAAPRLLLIPGKAAEPPAAGRHLSVVLPAGASPPGLEAPQPARKRQRLTHLSPEEKALRRKLKNRVAAQSARDRKKARMTELEQQVVELEEENQRLLLENQLLREKTCNLALENQELRCRLGLDALKVEEGSEPQQVQAQQSPLLITSTWILMTVIQTLSLISCWAFWTVWTQRCFSHTLVQSQCAWKSWRKTSVEKQIPYQPPPLPLWGPHQLSWRPLMN